MAAAADCGGKGMLLFCKKVAKKLLSGGLSGRFVRLPIGRNPDAINDAIDAKRGGIWVVKGEF